MQYLTLVEPFMYYNKLAVLPSRIIADCSDLNETVVSLCYIIHRLEYELQMKCWERLWKIQAKNFNAEGIKRQQAFLGKILLL
jgi:hypothetical protein